MAEFHAAFLFIGPLLISPLSNALDEGFLVHPGKNLAKKKTHKCG